MQMLATNKKDFSLCPVQWTFTKYSTDFSEFATLTYTQTMHSLESY